MKPLSIRDTLKAQGKARPNLRVLSDEDTARLRIRDRDWEEQDRRSRQASLVIVIACALVFVGFFMLAAVIEAAR